MKTSHSTARNYLALMIVTLLLAFVACKKSPETIGNGLISDNDLIIPYHTDALEVVCHSYLDSVPTKNVTYGLLGSMNDPVFGLSQAGFCTQFHLSSSGQNFGTNPVMDSLVLQFNLANYYGDTTETLTVHAYRLTDSLYAEEYYNYSEVPMDESVDHAGSFQFKLRPKTNSVVVGTDTVRYAIVRIPLSDELGTYLMTLDSTAYKEPDLFKEYFPGLCLRCEAANGAGSIGYLNLTDNTNTLLQLYYHNEATPEKPMRYNFYITSADTYFNQFSHDYTLGDFDFKNQVLEGDTAMGQQRIYLQTMGGVRAKLLFPNLDHLTDTLAEGSHIVINEAKLIVSAAETDTNIFTTPSTLILVGFSSDTSTYILPDYYEGTSYFGGSFNTITNSASFRISEYMQDVILGVRPNLGISLGINGASYNAQRLILNGPETENNPMRVELTYSIVKE